MKLCMRCRSSEKTSGVQYPASPFIRSIHSFDSIITFV
jgi:hypothetical protein